jgi:hypothetical protein
MAKKVKGKARGKKAPPIRWMRPRQLSSYLSMSRSDERMWDELERWDQKRWEEYVEDSLERPAKQAGRPRGSRELTDTRIKRGKQLWRTKQLGKMQHKKAGKILREELGVSVSDRTFLRHGILKPRRKK